MKRMSKQHALSALLKSQPRTTKFVSDCPVFIIQKETKATDAYLNAGEDGCYVIDRAPLVLEDVQADSAISVDCGGERRGPEIMRSSRGANCAWTSLQSWNSLLGWNMAVLNLTTGALFGYSSVQRGKKHAWHQSMTSMHATPFDECC